MPYTVKDVSSLSGVSIRALHHYDEIGLLKPDARNDSGYRLYSEGDLERLQQILFFKELDFGLEEIGKILDSPWFDRLLALREHRKILVEKKKRLDAIIAAVDKTMGAIEGGKKMKNSEMFDPFNESKMEEYKKEVREKYDKKIVDECERRTSKYSKADWKAIRKESDGIYEKVAELMKKGKAPDAADVQKQVARHFRMINDRFYTCTPQIYRGLGDLYVDDGRFRANFEKICAGLAEFMRDAMREYCDKNFHE